MQRISTLRGIAVLALVALGACDTSGNPAAPPSAAARPLRSLAGTALTVTNSGGAPLLSWNAVSGAVSYTVTLIRYNTRNGAYVNHGSTTLTTTTGTSYLDTARSYTGVYQCEEDTGMGFTTGYWYEYGVAVNYTNGTSYVSRHYAPIAEC